MPITSVSSDAAALTLTVVGDYPVSVERLWQAYADPRQLQRFWGPETWPATFTRHDMIPGGESRYFMTGPAGERSGGYWKFLRVEAERLIEVLDGFTRDDGTPNDQMPSMRMTFSFEKTTATGSRFTSVTHFPSVEAMEELVKMGMVEGLQSALGQLDGVLADLATFAADRAELQILDDVRVRVSRVIRGSVDQVWRAHHDPALLQRWMFGPDGWEMTGLEVATQVGDRYRY